MTAEQQKRAEDIRARHTPCLKSCDAIWLLDLLRERQAELERSAECQLAMTESNRENYNKRVELEAELKYFASVRDGAIEDREHLVKEIARLRASESEAVVQAESDRRERNAAQAELEKLRHRTDDKAPGTMACRFRGIREFSKKHAGHNPYSAKSPESTLMESFLAQQSELEALRKDRERLDGIPRRWGIDFHYPDDDGARGYWRITREYGGVNDREWREIGNGHTLRAAIDAACAVLEPHE